MDHLTLLLLVLGAAVIGWLISLTTDSVLASFVTIGLCLWGLYLGFTYPVQPETITIIIEHHHAPGGTS